MPLNPIRVAPSGLLTGSGVAPPGAPPRFPGFVPNPESSNSTRLPTSLPQPASAATVRTLQETQPLYFYPRASTPYGNPTVPAGTQNVWPPPSQEGARLANQMAQAGMCHLEPVNLPGYVLINPQCIRDKLDTCFSKVSCADPTPGGALGPRTPFLGVPPVPVGASPCDSGCTGQTEAYVNVNDPRLFDKRGFHVQLDSPPIESTLWNAGDVTGYGKGYRDYADINAGQITYYIDKSQQDAYFSPIFSDVACVEKVLHTDPMGRRSVMFPRQTIIGPVNDYCLSSLTDLSAFREELMATRMRAYNRTRYELNKL